MTLFQILLVAVVITAASLAVRFLPGERSLALKRIFAILFVAAAIFAILFPGALTAVANFFGIGRGTDLLLYLFIVAMLIFAVATVRAKARSDARVTDLARAVALIEARALEGRGVTRSSDTRTSATPKAPPAGDSTECDSPEATA